MTTSLDTSHDTSCRDLCERMIDALPRELRDMIYEYVLSDTICRNVAASTNEPTSSQAGPHYWHVEIIGATASKELLGVWYCSVRFHMGEDLGFIERFLSSNVICLDTPRHRFITKISITFNQRDVGSCRKSLEGEAANVSMLRTRLLERLEHLFLLRRGASIHVYVVVGCRDTRRAMMADRSSRHEKKVLRDVTTVMSDVLSRLSADGYRLATGIHLSSSRPNKDTLYDLCPGDSSVDRGDYFVTGDESGLIWRYVSGFGSWRKTHD